MPSVVLAVLASALVGLLTGGLINMLADDLPARRSPRAPRCPRCDHRHGPADWLAVVRRLRGRDCAACDQPVRRRTIWVEIVTAVLFGALPLIISEPRTLVFTAVYVAILVLVIVIDLEHRLILHVVTFPGTALALLGSTIVPREENTLLSALVGAAIGFVLFYLAYWFGRLVFGPGALGFGDVTLSMTMGAMLGFDRIFFALILAILLGGVGSFLVVLIRRQGWRSHMAYGPFLAIAGIAMLLWGKQVVDWYIVG